MEIKNVVETDGGFLFLCRAEEKEYAWSYLHNVVKIFIHVIIREIKPKIRSKFQGKPDQKIMRKLGKFVDLKCSVLPNRNLSIRMIGWKMVKLFLGTIRATYGISKNSVLLKRMIKDNIPASQRMPLDMMSILLQFRFEVSEVILIISKNPILIRIFTHAEWS